MRECIAVLPGAARRHAIRIRRRCLPPRTDHGRAPVKFAPPVSATAPGARDTLDPVQSSAEPRSGRPPRPGRRRGRDRRGRGLRGPLAPPEIPLSLTRAEQFDELVLDAVERLERRWPQLSGVEFAVEEVPPPGAELWSDEPVPLGRVVQAGPGEPARIVVYRRPLEVRAPVRADLGLLVHDIVVEQVADLLGLDPEIIDPE